MSFVDRSLQCSDCGSSFSFTASEQEFYASKGYTNDPKRCPSCREARKTERSSSSSYRGRSEMYPAVCADCGKETQVPFQPRQGRPVYCSDCYNKIRASNRS